MSRKYFLDDGIEYQPDSGELFVEGHLENLQSLENKLLQHFVTHPNELISKEDLYKVGWDGRIYGDNPLSKAISTLRSKLRDNPRSPRYIKTVPKKGFRFVSEVSEQPLDVTVLVPKAAQNQSITSLPLMFFVVAAVLMLLWFWINKLLEQTPQGPQFGNVLQLTHKAGQEQAPNLSADGKFIAFTRQLSHGQFAQIVVIPMHGGIEKTITTRDYHNFTPVWHSDGRRLLYHRYSPGRCEIAVMELDLQLNITSDQVLIECGQYNQSIGLSWGPDNTIYYTDIDIEFAAHNIYRLDLDSGKRHLLNTPEDTVGKGYYRIQFDADANVLHTLLSDDWYYTKVLTLNLDGEIINEHQVNVPLLSVSSYAGNPVFKNEGNNIYFLRGKTQHQLMQSPLWPIYSPHVSNSEPPTLALVGGSYNNAELVLIDLNKQSETVLSTGDIAHKYPISSASGDTYFISNRSGIYQVWKTFDDDYKQLSQFESNMRIEDIAIAADESYIALSIERDIHVYQLDNTTFLAEQPYMKLKNSVNPHFSPDSKVLWFSRKTVDSYQMNAMALATKSAAQPPVNNAYLGMFDQQSGQHYAFKYEQPGIWKIQDSKMVWFNESPFISNVCSAAINDEILTYYSNEKAKLMQLDLAANTTTELLDAPYRYFSTVKGQNDQLIVSRPRFADTHIFVVQYQN
ncbi:MAG: winged helix-turn-helix domain-containing protein [Algicola sp.]|nr:winged helix-turn-helix domain-containing protein [Algicola sp.]